MGHTAHSQQSVLSKTNIQLKSRIEQTNMSFISHFVCYSREDKSNRTKLTDVEGESDGWTDGEVLGESDGWTEGDVDGLKEGETEGLVLGESDGATLGLVDGWTDGETLSNE